MTEDDWWQTLAQHTDQILPELRKKQNPQSEALICDHDECPKNDQAAGLNIHESLTDLPSCVCGIDSYVRACVVFICACMLYLLICVHVLVFTHECLGVVFTHMCVRVWYLFLCV